MENTPISGISSVKGDSGATTHMIYLQGHAISVKLDDSNYLLWKQQVLATLEGFGLEGFLTGERKCPERFTPGTSDETTAANPDFIAWNRQDRLITSWLLSSMTNGILVAVVGLTTTKEIWDTLESNFASQSRAKLMQLKYQLQTLKKGSMNMHEYLNKVKTYCDMLGSAGEQVTDENQILHILAGLGSEYNPVMVSITSRVEPCSLREARAMLLHFEGRLEFVEQPNFSSDGSSPSVNYATHTPQNKNCYSQGGNRGRGNGFNRGRGQYRGRGGRFNNNWRPRCQICQIIGHTADRCIERPNLNYTPNFNYINRNGGNTQRNFGFRSTSSNYEGNQFGGKFSANVASMNACMDNHSEMTWYPDSGASNHVTYDCNNLNTSAEYEGSDKLQVGNGAGYRQNNPPREG